MKVDSLPSALGDRLQQARGRLFVGRAAEMTSWCQALNQSQWDVPLWHIHGLGGIGKTSLLRQWKQLASENNVPVVSIDARDFAPTPQAFCEALREALNGALALSIAVPATALFQAIATLNSRLVLQIDSFERLSALDHWLREGFLPRLPANAMVMMASREPLPLAWHSDAGWREMVKIVALEGLSRAESDDYLQKRGVEAGAQAQLVEWTHGHPLALSLAADVWLQHSAAPQPFASLFSSSSTDVFKPAALPHLMGPLLAHLVGEVPGPSHRAALEACATVRVLTEELLSHMLETETGAALDVHALFEWLRGLSIIETHRFGLSPHQIAREVLVADLRWRNPALHTQLHGRAREHYQRRIHQLTEVEQQRAIFDYIFLHRMSPVVAPFMRWNDSRYSIGAARNDEREELLSFVERHEGAASRDIAARWFAAQPEGVLAVRNENGAAQGLVFELALQRAQRADIETDPAALAVSQHLAAGSPLREGEVATLFRFWMDKDHYQDVGATQSLIFVHAVRHYITTPHLAFTLFPCAAPDFWRDGFLYADQQRLPQLDFQVGERTYGGFGHDWRARPLLAWFDLLSQREQQSVAIAPPPPPSVVPQATFGVLGEEAFDAAVRLGLRNWSDPTSLRRNPLLETSLVHRRARHFAAASKGLDSNSSPAPSLDERVFALRWLLREAVAALALIPRQERAYRALELVYGRRALSQEAAAVVMNVSHSSFRRYLRAALAFVGKSLWHREIFADMVDEPISLPKNGQNEQNLNLF